jgi:hypothetical protein
MLERSISDEVEAAIKAASADKHLETVRRVTDLFLAQADGYSGEQIELFGDVLERLIKTIEIRAHRARRNEHAARLRQAGAAGRDPPAGAA